MDLRTRFTAETKTSMLAGDAARTSTLRMIVAKMKDSDIAARSSSPPGPPLDDAALVTMLRGMAKSRRESVDMYRQGNRPELAAKEEAEIAVIEAFLPQQMDETAMAAAIQAAITATSAATIKDMGRVMAALRTEHAATLDMAKAGPMVKAALGG
ncbi:MAG: GatB/YqeY domain-containing protein [Rubritepida sp.]|nr:GatB/YqeY domain-containing protein [Rubritepida sp.]